MFSLRSKSEPARIASAATLLSPRPSDLGGDPGAAAAAPAEGEEPPPPQLAFEPGSYDFGLHEANRETSQTNFQLRNVGSVPAPIYSIQIVGSGSCAFWTGNSDCFNHSLEPGETCSIQVSFNPIRRRALLGPAARRIRRRHQLHRRPQRRRRPPRTDRRPPTRPTSARSPVGSGGVTKTIDVTNEGNMPGGAFIAVISGGAVGSFHLLDENCTGIPLSPDATCNLQVNFDPISTGAKTARLFLVGDGDGGAQISLTGVGLDPASQSGGASSPQAGRRAQLSRSRSRAASAATAVSAATSPRASPSRPRRATR